MIINIKEIFLVFLSIHPLTLCSDYIICLWQSSLFFKKKKEKKEIILPGNQNIADEKSCKCLP